MLEYSNGLRFILINFCITSKPENPNAKNKKKKGPSSIIVVHLISHILATPLHNISLMELLLSKWTKVGKNAISAFWLIEEKATIQMLRRLRLFLGPSWKTLGLCWALHVVKVSDSP